MIIFQLFLIYLFFGLLYTLNSADFYKQFCTYRKQNNSISNFKYSLEYTLFNRMRLMLIMSYKLQSLFFPIVIIYILFLR